MGNFWAWVIGLVIGLFIGHCIGQCNENKLWLDAVCGRENI